MRKITTCLAGIAFILASCSKSSDDSNPTTTNEIGNTGVTTTIPIVPPTNPNLPKGSTSTDSEGNTTTTVNTYNADGTLNAEIAVKVAKDGTKTKVIKKYTYDANKNVTKVVTYDANLADDSVKTPIEEVTYEGHDSKGQHTVQTVTKYDEKGNVESSVKDKFELNHTNVGTTVSKIIRTVTYEGKTRTYELSNTATATPEVTNVTLSGNDSEGTYHLYEMISYNDYRNLTSVNYDTNDSYFNNKAKTFTYTTILLDKPNLITSENPYGMGTHKVKTEKYEDYLQALEVFTTYNYNDAGKLVSKEIVTKRQGAEVSKETIKYEY